MIFTNRKYVSSRYDYYHELNCVQTLDSFKTILTSTINRPINTSTAIQFFEIDFGTGIKGAIKALGLPRFTIKDSPAQNQTTLFYKGLVGKYNDYVQLHFLDDSFCYGCISFHQLNAGGVSTINEALKSKYITDLEAYSSVEYIHDVLNNRILPECHGAYSLHYISGENKPLIEIDRQIDGLNNSKKRSEATHILMLKKSL